ncbi:MULTISPECIES: YbjQ family protein [unclassified Psychrobacter]|uniref:YbjQ family protein n=1 Tax=unclassified Psychrobacter TaxID=196806 RepID=UPI0025B2EAD9|nr:MULTISPECIES: YbjQ family protein [unclassified Psychrobacter]MDN3453890.1 YbjQ family protein [Psychrobacter sp. APC 3350]MDN3503337.1 YbjQ family protein [Psychrobacter sp. 5A.1]
MTVQLSNLEHLPNYQITERLDVVYGSTVRSKHVGKDLFAGLKNIVGGELTAYTELLEESRQEAIDRMIVKAESLGADAVVGLRFSTSSIAQGASELFVYGTAVKAVPISQQQYQNPSSDSNNHTDQHPNTQNHVTTDDLPRFNPFD